MIKVLRLRSRLKLLLEIRDRHVGRRSTGSRRDAPQLLADQAAEQLAHAALDFARGQAGRSPWALEAEPTSSSWKGFDRERSRVLTTTCRYRVEPCRRWTGRSLAPSPQAARRRSSSVGSNFSVDRRSVLKVAFLARKFPSSSSTICSAVRADAGGRPGDPPESKANRANYCY